MDFTKLRSTQDILAPQVDLSGYDDYSRWLYDRSAWYSTLEKGDESWKFYRREALMAEKHFGHEGLWDEMVKRAIDGKTPSSAPDYIRGIASKVDEEYGFSSLKAYRLYLDYTIEHDRGLA